MVDAFGTSTPTSTTVVATSTSMSPRANACMIGILLVRGHLAVQDLDAQVGECGMPRQQVGDLDDAPARARRLALDDRDRLVGGVVLHRRLGVDRGAHDERLVALADLLGDPVPDAREPRRLLGERRDEGLDAGASLGHRADRRDVEVAEHRHRDGARDRRRGEHERVRRRRPSRAATRAARRRTGAARRRRRARGRRTWWCRSAARACRRRCAPGRMRSAARPCDARPPAADR